MGYTTDFYGKIKLTPALDPVQVAYLQAFNETRRMSRDPEIAAGLPDPKREAVGLPIGNEGEYFVGAGGWAGQDHDASILGYNNPPSSQPGLWCQWRVSDNGKYLEWDGGEKFYEYIEWMKYMTEHFFKPWNIQMNGDIRWKGEYSDDKGYIEVVHNAIHVHTGENYDTYKGRKAQKTQARKQKKVLQKAVEEKFEHMSEPPRPKM